jgi:pyruvate formate lyase activating enzyme
MSRKKREMERQTFDNKGTVFNIQRFSLQDGPGIRTTVFLKGCPLRCLWCSNPESQDFSPEVAHSTALCNQCGECIKVCPRQAISLAEKGIKIERKLCTKCGECVNFCYAGALKVYGKEITITEVCEEVEKDVAYYRNSDGGVTLSGGEPFAQPGFVISLLRQLKKTGFHNNVDTCGYAEQKVMNEALQYTDLVFYDLKHMNGAAHKRLTGISNKRILNNFKLVAESGVELIVRVPIIPEINDSKDNIKSIAEFVARFKSVKEVNLLPYHRFGLGKYEMLDRPYLLDSKLPPNRSYLEELKNLILGFKLECKIVD